MDLFREILLHLLIATVHGHMCILKERHDNETERGRWSLPSKERCHCQGIVKIKTGKGPKRCRPGLEEIEFEDIWFTDDADFLAKRSNWKKAILDELLDRNILCDHENPVIHNLPNNITSATDYGLPTAVVTWIEPTATDNSGYQNFTSSHFSGESFHIGVTMVYYTSIDRSGNTQDGSFCISITDRENPVIHNLPNNITSATDYGSPTAVVTWIEPTATDNSGYQTTLNSSHTSGEAFQIGVTMVTYTSVDLYGNAEESRFFISITDRENPVIHGLPNNITSEAHCRTSTAVVTWIGPTATDNSGFQTLTWSHSPGESFQIGVTIVSYTSVDRSGNTDGGEFFISITAADANWILNGDFCYYFAHTSRSLSSQAEIDCQSKNAFLASIHSLEEHNFIISHLEPNVDYWIGYQDKVTEGLFKWVDDTPTIYENWGPSQPNNYGNQDCTILWALYSWKWADQSCELISYQAAHVCKK